MKKGLFKMNIIKNIKGLFLLLISILFLNVQTAFSQAPECNHMYSISGSTIRYYDAITNTSGVNSISCPGSGLAVNRNYFNNGPDPTFYTVLGGNFYYWDGTTWTNTGHTAGNNAAVNPGGAGPYIYNVDGTSGTVFRYDGTGNATFFLNVPNWTGPYDCVGDNLGNLYVIHLPNNAAQRRIDVYDPNANLVCTYHLVNIAACPAGGGFGIVNGVVYIGIWSGTSTGTVTGPLEITFTPGSPMVARAGDYGSCPLNISADTILGPPEVCMGDTVHWRTFGDGTWYSENSSVATVSDSGVVAGMSPGTTTIRFVSNSASSGLGGGCIVSGNGNDTIQKTITVNPLPDVNLGRDTSFCSGQSTTLDAGFPGSTYEWNTQATTQTINVNSTGTYSVKVTNSGGCTGTDSIKVTILPPIKHTFDTTICRGDTVTFAGHPYTDDVLAADSVQHLFTTPGGCDSIVYFSLTVHESPNITITSEQDLDKTYCIGQRISLKAEGAKFFYWFSSTTETLLPDRTSPKITGVLGKETNVFRVSGYSKWFCMDTAEVIVNAKLCCDIFVPSAFSPNNDGVNDYFRAKPIGNPTGFQMKVFNRLGQLVFMSNNINNGWDGTVNGKPCANGVYFYYITGSCWNGKPFEKKGDITLVR